MDFIFMLTRDDRTVADCLAVADAVRPLGLGHIGFKDVGADADTLAELTRRIRAGGARSYLESVATTPGAAVRAARLAVEIGVDCLLGGIDLETVPAVLAGANIAWHPFAGRPHAHPTLLDGSPEDIARDCRAALARGCAGVDLLAWRATEAEPLALVRAARAALGREGRLIVAGSINGAATVRALAAAGADAFTVGTAVFDGSFAPGAGGIEAQLRAVLAAARPPAQSASR